VTDPASNDVSLRPTQDQTWPLWAALALVAVSIGSAMMLAGVVRSGWLVSLDGAQQTLAYFFLYTTPYAVAFLLARVFAAIFGWRFGPSLGFRTFDALKGIALAIGVAIVGRVLSTMWGVVITLLGFEPPAELDVTALMPSDALGIVLLIALVVVIGPVVEEIVFRGALYPAIRARTGAGLAMVLSGVVFGLIHVDLLWLVVPTALLGIALAWLYETTRSLWVPILCHAVFNLTALALAFLFKSLGLV
jgi:membrane protease YdiL (CAAX protease family)